MPTPMSRALAQAREAKGLSQRELAKRAGLTQAQISKIETGSADLTVSSLTELARALDLDVMLVPMTVVPAVKGIVRDADKSPTSQDILRELFEFKQAANSFSKTARGLPEVETLHNLVRLLGHIELPRTALGTLQHLTAKIKAAQSMLESAGALRRYGGHPGTMRDLQRAIDKVRHTIAHGLPIEPEPLGQPAYTLDDNADE